MFRAARVYTAHQSDKTRHLDWSQDDIGHAHRVVKRNRREPNALSRDVQLPGLGILFAAQSVGAPACGPRRRAAPKAEFDSRDIRTIVRALFDAATEADLKAAFAVFDRDGEGSLDAEEFREMLPLLAGDESLPFARVEMLFKQADRDHSGVLEYTEFVWLLANLNQDQADPNGVQRIVHIKSVEELKADRLRAAQQSVLSERARRLRSKADVLARAASLLHQEKPLVCAELLMRLHKIELEESRALRQADKTAAIPDETADGLLLRGTPALLDRRGEVLIRALASLAVEEREKSLNQLRQAIRSIDEELPVTETASHGLGRSRGLHARADRLQLVVEVLGAPGGLATASALVEELMSQMKAEADVLTAAPASIARGSEESMRAMRQRLGRFSQLQLMLQTEQVSTGKQHAIMLARQMRTDAQKVVDFATQGVYVPPHAADLPVIESAESVSTGHKYAQRWARCRALLVASEKVSQVLQLVRHGRRRSLQEGVQLLVTMEEGDMPTLFSIARDIMRATDAEEQRAAAKAAEDAAKAASERAALGYPPDPDAAAPPLPQKTVWWHQIDDENDEAYEVRDFSDWHATRDLRKGAAPPDEQ